MPTILITSYKLISQDFFATPSQKATRHCPSVPCFFCDVDNLFFKIKDIVKQEERKDKNIKQ